MRAYEVATYDQGRRKLSTFGLVRIEPHGDGQIGLAGSSMATLGLNNEQRPSEVTHEGAIWIARLGAEPGLHQASAFLVCRWAGA
ncbi:hypothetical protein [Nocardioides zeae]